MTCASSQLRQRIAGLPPEARGLVTDTLRAMAFQPPRQVQSAARIEESMRRTTRMGSPDAMRLFD